MPPPHVIVFVLDDMRLDDLAWMPRVQATLVDKGVSFASHYSTTPLCCPSRASLLTGQYPHRTGVLGDDAPFDIQAFDETSTLGTWLTAAGYTTCFVGKYLNGYGKPAFPVEHVPPGWAVWRVPYAHVYNYLQQQVSVDGLPVDRSGAYSTRLYADYAAEFLTENLPLRKPLYLQVNMIAPHGGLPLDPDDPVDGRRLATPYVDPFFRGRYQGPTLPDTPAYDERVIADKPALGDLPRITAEEAVEIQRSMQQRRDSLLAVDKQIARLIHLVSDAGQSKDTVFVFVSDNGYFEGEHRITFGKTSHYEPAVHVPLVIRGPGFPHGVVSDQLTGVHDIAPTIVQATGAQAPGSHVFDGRPLQRILAHTPPRAVLLEISDPTGVRTLRGVVSHDRWKYVEISSGFVEMYDLRADPYELRNRADDPAYAQRRAELAALLDRVDPPR